jgi:hypothetical protein
MTFAQLKAKLADWLGLKTEARLSAAARGDCVNMAMRELLRRHTLRYGEISDSFPTVVGDWDYDVPSNWVRPHSLYYLDDNGDQAFLEFRDKKEFDELHPNIASDVGDPEIYTVWGGSILLGPTPNSVRTIYRNYYQVLADMAGDGDHNIFTDNAWEAVFWKSLVFASMYLTEDARVPLWKEKAEEVEIALVQEHAQAASFARRPISKIPG